MSTYSSGFGMRNIYTIEADGLLMIDVLEAVKLKERLPEYSLRYVTHEFLKDVNLVKGDLKPKQIFEYYDNGNPEVDC